MAIIKSIRSWAKGYIRYQITPLNAVKPEHRWSQRDRAFYLNSVAGLIRFKPKDTQDLTRFRDKYINRFEVIRDGFQGEGQRIELFKLYDEIRAKERVRYKANWNTRWKARTRYAFSKNRAS